MPGRVLIILFCACCALNSIAALAQGAVPAAGYPIKPVRWIIPYSAGGSSDTRVRQLQPLLTDIWGQPIIVDNKPGAGGIIGTDLIAKAQPDGYTIGMANFGPLVVSPSLLRTLPYDPLKDVVPVVLIERGPLVLMVNPATSVSSVKELVALAKEKPGSLTFASSGSGSSHHLSGEMFKSMTGIDVRHVPYKGGKLRALAVTSPSACRCCPRCPRSPRPA